jgi:hypothetical protein
MTKRKTQSRSIAKTILPASKLTRLRELFQRNGYVRLQDQERVESDGRSYKKGDEVRLVADSRAELAEIRRLLAAGGFKLGRPFAKGNQFRQPLYGREQVARFVSLMRKPKK